MATIKETRDAIKALPGMTAIYSGEDQEWRVAFDFYRISERFPDKNAAWCEQWQEAAAYYTEDADDALATAQAMSERWVTLRQNGSIVDFPEGEAGHQIVYQFGERDKEGERTMYNRLRAEGFAPRFQAGVGEAGIYERGVAVPLEQVAKLRELQRSNPAQWGNHPDVAADLESASLAAGVDSIKRHKRLAALSEDQREFIEVLHRETGMYVDEALDFNDKLHGLAAIHLKLALVTTSAGGLNRAEERAVEDVERQIGDLVAKTPGVSGVKFMYDPRGETVGLMFDSGASNSFNGSYKVPVNSAFSAAVEDAYNALMDKMNMARYLSVTIESTGNAAFVDAGRSVEVGRILEEAAGVMAQAWDNAGERMPLRDGNGNTVGHLEFSAAKPEEPEAAEFWLEVMCSGDGEDPAIEAAEYLREAAGMLWEKPDALTLKDVNGNTVGSMRLVVSNELDLGDKLDMAKALGDVYLADDGYSGIADGEYRYVVPTNDFEPGYRQGEGDAWLVNAKGEKAPGYEEPQTVRETDFRALKPDELRALRDVVEGRVAFEEFERQFNDEGLEP